MSLEKKLINRYLNLSLALLLVDRLFILNLIVGAVSSKELFSKSPRSLSRSSQPCCDQHTLSCHDVDVDPESLLSDENISINGLELAFSNIIPPHGRTYKTKDGDEAVISYSRETGNIFGILKTNDGKSFALEKSLYLYLYQWQYTVRL